MDSVSVFRLGPTEYVIPVLETLCSVCVCCCAPIARKRMHCLVTAGKHVNNTRAITRQLFGKRVPAATNTHAAVEVLLGYNNRTGVFYVIRAEIL
jgi:hypothetical protein